MALEAIGDIGNPTLQTVQTLTWESATEWNNAVSQTRTEHEPERDETRIRLGRQNTEHSPLGYWRFHSGSGSTLVDVSGNNNDGSINGPVWASAPSPRFAGALDGDGTDDVVNFGNFWSTSESYYEFECWFYPQATGTQKIMEQDGLWTMFYDRSGNQDLNFATFGANADMGPSLSTDTWHHAYFRWEVSNQYVAYINGSSYTSSTADAIDSTTSDMGIFDDPAGDAPFNGKIAEARAWSGSSPAVSGVSDTLYITDGLLETGTKSFSTAQTPDLQNLDYSLNGQTIDLDVIGSPGTSSEEVVTQTLDGSTAYTLTWSNSHSDFRVRPNYSTTDATASPQVNRIELTT